MHPMLLSNEQYIPRNRTLYLTLSLHTYESVKYEYLKHKDKLGASLLTFDYFYPIIPHVIINFNSTEFTSNKEEIKLIWYLFDRLVWYLKNILFYRNVIDSSHRPTFVMQGIYKIYLLNNRHEQKH